MQRRAAESVAAGAGAGATQQLLQSPRPDSKCIRLRYIANFGCARKQQWQAVRQGSDGQNAQNVQFKGICGVQVYACDHARGKLLLTHCASVCRMTTQT
jgi:hypothetical protein